MKKFKTKSLFKRIVATTAAALMAIELIPLSSLTTYAANLEPVSGITDASTAAGFAKMDATVKSDDSTFDGASATVTMTDGGDEYNKAIQALRDSGIAVDYREAYVFEFSASNNDTKLDMSKAKVDIDAEWGLIPSGYSYMGSANYDVYVYDGTSVREQKDGISKEDFMDMGYYSGYDKFTINGNEKVIFANKLTPHQALEPGVYSIDANLTVLGKNNAVLPGVQVYLTNTELPPVEALKQNGVLTINNDGTMSLSIENFSPIFTLQNIEDGSDVHIIKKEIATSGLEDPKPTTRINGLTLSLDNYNGFYSFTNAKQYPAILTYYTEMPVDLIVDFDSAELIYKPDSGKTEYTKSFTDEETGITATVRTTDETQGKKLDGATFKASKITGDEYEDIYYRMYRYRYSDSYAAYDFSLTASDGSKLATDKDHNNIIVNISGIDAGDVSYPAASIIGDEFTDYSVSFSSNKAAVNLNSMCKMVFYDIQYTEILHSDSIAEDGSGFSMIRYTNLAYYAKSDGEARSELSDTENKYFAKVSSTSSSSGSMFKCGDRFEISIPTDSIKKHIYFIMTDGENTYVREYKNNETWIMGEKTYFNLYDTSNKYSEGRHNDTYGNLIKVYKCMKDAYDNDCYSSSLYGEMLQALNNGYNKVTPDAEHPVGYILTCDNAYAGMPAKRGLSTYITKTTYSGIEQTENMWMFADNSSVTGTLNATNAGTYSFTVTPDEGYTWFDGTTEPKQYTWEMSKAFLSVKVNLSKQVVSSDDSIPEASIKVTQFVNGETPETAAGYVAPEIIDMPEKLEKGQVYTIKTMGGSADNYTFGTGKTTLTVLKDGQICVQIPEIEEPVYDGKSHSAASIMREDEASKQYYTATNTDYEMVSPTDSSYYYPIKLSLKDKDNFIWSDGTTKDISKWWNIKKAELTISYVSETVEEGQTPTLELKYEGFVEGDNIDNQKSLNTDIKVVAPDVLEGGKTYELTPIGNQYLNRYNITYKSGTLTVLKKKEEVPDENAKTVTANLIVPGELNTQLPGVTAYMTNPDNPLGIVPDGYESVNAVAPTTPVKDNAKLTDNGDGTYNLTLNIPNPVFTLQKIGDCSNAEIVSAVRDNKVYSGNTGVSRNGRITKLTIKLKDTSGTYIFNDCTEFPTLLETDWNVPLTLKVDFPSDDNNTVDTSNITIVSDIEKTTDNTPTISIKGISSEAKDYFKSLLTKEDVEKIASADNKLTFKLTAGNITDTVSSEDKDMITEALNKNSLNNYVVGQYLDINASLSIINKNISTIENGGIVTLSVKLDNNLINKEADRTYKIVRIHTNNDGTKTASILDTTYDSITGSIKFDTDRLSTYAIAYSDNISDTISPGTNDTDIETGDTNNSLFFIALMAAALAVISGTIVISRKKAK